MTSAQKTIEEQLKKETDKALVKKWIDDMIAVGFMSGWGGDKSDKFKNEQFDSMMKVLAGDVQVIGGNYRLLATIQSDYGNLKQYCDWDEVQCGALLALFGFKSIKEVFAVMGCSKEDLDRFMLNGKLNPAVKFQLKPVIY